LECRYLQDGNNEVLEIDANTLNATNPNGASTYYLEDFSELLTLLKSSNTEKIGEQQFAKPNQ